MSRLKKEKNAKRNIILFINFVPSTALESIKKYNKKHKTRFKAAVIVDSHLKRYREILAKRNFDKNCIIVCDTTKPLQISKALLLFQDKLLCVVSRSEINQSYLQKIIPHVPYVRTPTAMSLSWSTDKVAMRELFRVYDKKITPKFIVAKNASKSTLKEIEKRVGFPLIIKPASLSSSLLITICYHKEELEKNLKYILRRIRAIYKENQRQENPKIMVEEFMEGDMYSIDAYVSSRGKIYFCPPVYIKIGRAVGFDDFFGYQQMTPTVLTTSSIEDMKAVAQKGIHALGLRSVTAHVELIRTESGWKLLEIGPRMGGFRHELYNLSYGIDHTMNDILIRAAKVPEIPKKKKGYAVAMKFYAKTEGKLIKLKGIIKIRNLKSFYRIDINKQIGDRCKFAKNGGKSVFNLILFNKKRSMLLADIRRAEQAVLIKTDKT